MTRAFSVDVKGVSIVAGVFDRMTGRAAQMLKRTIRERIEVVAAESLEEAPREFGDLRGSQQSDVVTRGGELVGFVEFTAPYAWAVHEIPEPPQQSEGGRSARHKPPSKWKYLEDPFKRHAMSLHTDVMDAVNRGDLL